MTNQNERITSLEEYIAHQQTMLEELNEVIVKLRGEVDILNKRVEMLMLRAAEQEADSNASVPLADQRPPHW